MDLHAVLARCLGNTPGSTFLCCSISLQVYTSAWETAERPAVSLKQLKAPEERQGRLHAGPFPAVSVDWQLKTWRGMGDPVGITDCIFKIKVMCGGQMIGFPPVAARECHPCQLSHPPPPLPCTNLTFTVPPVPAHLSDNQLFSLPPPPPPPSPVKVFACYVYCHDEVMHQCSMLSGDPAGPPHGT